MWMLRTNNTNTNKQWNNYKSDKVSTKRGILLNGTTEKIISHEGGFLKFLAPLTRVGLPLMKNVLTPLAKSV